MSGQWSYRPERAPECMNGRYKCTTYECVKLLKKPGTCMACRKKLWIKIIIVHSEES